MKSRFLEDFDCQTSVCVCLDVGDSSHPTDHVLQVMTCYDLQSPSI